MRLFAGIDLPAEVRENLAALLGGLRPCARLNWSPAENLHITTKFIGEWSEDRLDALVAALRSLPPRQPIGIALRGLGWFPNAHGTVEESLRPTARARQESYPTRQAKHFDTGRVSLPTCPSDSSTVPCAPKIFWVGVKADGGLAELARHTDETVARLGVPPERRPFSPHLTLARIRKQVPLARLRDAVAALPSADFGEFTASRFHLFLSETAASGSVYTKLAEFPLAQS